MEGRMRQRSGTQDRKNVARTFALVLGLGYVAAGVIGFFATGFTGPVVLNTNDAILGFDVNIFHNIVHLAIGGGLVVASRLSDVAVTQGILIGVGLFYVVATLLGFINYMQLISINSSLAADNFLHLFSGATAVIFGLIGVRQTDRSVKAQPDMAWAP